MQDAIEFLTPQISEAEEEEALARASCRFGPYLATTALGFIRYTRGRGTAAIGMPPQFPRHRQAPAWSPRLPRYQNSLPLDKSRLPQQRPRAEVEKVAAPQEPRRRRKSGAT